MEAKYVHTSILPDFHTRMEHAEFLLLGVVERIEPLFSTFGFELLVTGPEESVSSLPAGDTGQGRRLKGTRGRGPTFRCTVQSRGEDVHA
jgi:hypothetical protein